MEWTSLNGRYLLAEVQTLTTGSSSFMTTTMGTSNTKGGFFPLVTGVEYDSYGILLNFQSNLSRDMLIDFSFSSGTAGIFLSNLYMSVTSNSADVVYLPIKVPAYTPIFARGQQSTATATLTAALGITFLHNDWNDTELFDRVTTYGPNTAASTATQVDCGAAANTWSGWVTLTSGTAYPISAFLLSIGDNDNLTLTDGFYLFEVAVGDVGQEVPIFRGATIANSQDDALHPHLFGPIYLTIPEGSRVSVRGQSSVTDATDRIFTIALYGFD